MIDPNDGWILKTNGIGRRGRASRIAVWLLLLAPIRVAQAAPTLQPPFDAEYTLVDLAVPGVPPGYGGLTFVPGDPNTIVIAGWTETVGGLVYAITVTRDATGSIDGVDGVGLQLAEAYGVSSGVAYGPGDVLFYTRATNEIGEIKPGSTVTDKVVSLSRFSPYYPSGLTFVPSGYAGQGKLKFVGFVSGQWWSAGVIPDNHGTFDIFAVTAGPTIDGGPSGFDYVLRGGPAFPYQSIVVSEFYTRTVSTYDIDANGDPIVATRREVITDFDSPDGVASDPLTGDFLITNYYGSLVVMRSSPVPTTSTSSSTTTTRPTTTTSSTTTSTTSTTRPTSTTSSTSSSTTTSTTITRPTTTNGTTSTTSSTQPTTTTSSTSTSTTTGPSTTTTTLAAASCPHGSPLESITCGVDDLLAFVRAASALGPYQRSVIARLETAREAATSAAQACAARQRGDARDALKRVDRQMIVLRARLRTKRARRIVPPDLAGAVGDAARDIDADVRVLRGTIVCP
jgi:hypothetical protein